MYLQLKMVLGEVRSQTTQQRCGSLSACWEAAGLEEVEETRLRGVVVVNGWDGIEVVGAAMVAIIGFN